MESEEERKDAERARNGQGWGDRNKKRTEMIIQSQGKIVIN